jgi:transposase InsO family protein
MDEKQRERIALFRYSVIGPLASAELAHGELKRRIRELSTGSYIIPNSRRKTVRAGTIAQWLHWYRKNGIEGLKPKQRSDSGALRGIPDDIGKAIIEKRAQHPRMPLRIVLRRLQMEKDVPALPIPLSTAYRYLRTHLPKRTIPTTGREQKRFTHRYPNDCWQGDTMHGIYIRDDQNGRSRKTYLIAFIDDATRLIVGGRFFFSETVQHVKEVLREAVLTYGVPAKLYLDNGRNFCAEDIEMACAAMRCALIHTTAYYPEGKGKIERFFRTVRDSFITGLSTVHSLNELNEAFDAWLQHEYNRRPHGGIDGAVPLDTFLKNAENRLRRLPAAIDPAELFCRKESRQVAKDATFRINNALYETEEHLIGRKINVLFDKDDPLRKAKVFDGELYVHTVKPIDYIANSQVRRREINPDNNDMKGTAS